MMKFFLKSLALTIFLMMVTMEAQEAKACDVATIDLRGQEPKHRKPLIRKPGTDLFPITFKITAGSITNYQIEFGSYSDRDKYGDTGPIPCSGNCDSGSTITHDVEPHTIPPTSSYVYVTLQWYDPCLQGTDDTDQKNKGDFVDP